MYQRDYTLVIQKFIKDSPKETRIKSPARVNIKNFGKK